MKNKKSSKWIVAIIALVLIGLGVAYSHNFFKTLPGNLMICSSQQSAPTLIAHRGLSSLYPQNTVPAFEGAAEYGYKYYELDVHTTKDGQWVVIHNDTVDAMTNGEGDVASFTLEEIKELKIDSGKGIKNYEDLTVPTLAECLEVCKKTGILPVIELKKLEIKYLPTLVDMLEEYGLSEQAKIISFDKEYLQAYRELDGKIDMLYLSHNPSKQDIDWCIENNFGINYNCKKLYKCFSAISYAKKKGVTIGAWTVDNTVIADVMVLFGAEYITTNKILP